MDTEPPLPLATISLAFEHLKNDVRRALNTQVGDVARLDEQIAMCTNLEQHIQYVSLLFYFWIRDLCGPACNNSCTR